MFFLISLFSYIRRVYEFGEDGITDDDVSDILNVDSENENMIRGIINRYVVPTYEAQTEKRKKQIAESLKYYLTKSEHDHNNMKKHINLHNTLGQCVPPDERNLILWTWEAIFGKDADYHLQDLEKYVVDNNLF